MSAHQRIGIYGGIVGGAVTIVTFRAILTFLICLAAARTLHDKMFRSILRVPILFFDTNPVGVLSLYVIHVANYVCLFRLIGRVLNRFSTDTGLLDSVLPYLFLYFFTVSHPIKC